jgi:pimeloyl-ACP methyl ester carboxylesterase
MPCNDQYGPRALAVEDSVLAAVSAPVRSIARIRTVRTCALWTDRTEPARLPIPMGSRTPVLIVVGEYDVSAPPEDGRWIASLLRNATLVEMPAQGHADAALPEQPCAQRIMSQFSQEPTRPVDTSCVAGLPGIRFVTQW